MKYVYKVVAKALEIYRTGMNKSSRDPGKFEMEYATVHLNVVCFCKCTSVWGVECQDQEIHCFEVKLEQISRERQYECTSQVLSSFFACSKLRQQQDLSCNRRTA